MYRNFSMNSLRKFSTDCFCNFAWNYFSNTSKMSFGKSLQRNQQFLRKILHNFFQGSRSFIFLYYSDFWSNAGNLRIQRFFRRLFREFFQPAIFFRKYSWRNDRTDISSWTDLPREFVPLEISQEYLQDFFNYFSDSSWKSRMNFSRDSCIFFLRLF